MAKDMQMPRRVISKTLGVPVPTAGPVEKKLTLSKENVLAILGEDYRVNQGLHMTFGDINADDEGLGKVIDALQEKGLVMTYRNRKGVVELVKANYKGLKKAYPKEHYRWAPEFVNSARVAPVTRSIQLPDLSGG
ncbi:hypothetical protein Psch_01295 [Pelotomaculum schinkii]|uniref:Uncharacterized protein n=1 Tax=Pelotomaculum schinkii TaxID=78350 RepID=A0A4Y7RG66_9FIRM|nr:MULTISPECIES: hypothetical protein [Pelotomaculum]TEB07740.1 hypothetical protein Psch_01295 [Pelotomaculum schinkii]TEB16079.1 hypothetical protein Psfp_01677 [Pelotomaculum sp. FP]